jgi:predicted aminopeptidase
LQDTSSFSKSMANRSRTAAFWRANRTPASPAKRLKSYLSGILVVSSVLSGCSPSYVMRAAYEEGKILWRREPIVRFLERSEVEADTREKLKLVLAVREYARDVLKLKVGGSYASFSYVDRPELSFILTAAPKTELEPYTWWFLIVGRMPYKGYFSKEAAESAAAELQAEGYDTTIRPSAAYSTLGWFDDPLLAHLLKYDKVTLADLVFHELFHNTLYVKGAGHFNESVANFVGGRAAIEFFREKFGQGSAEHQLAMKDWQQALEFSAYLDKLAESLNELYARDIAYEEKLRLREEIFTQAQKDWQQRIGDRPSHRFRRFIREPLNNAVIIHYMLYLKNLNLFESLYDVEGRSLVRTIDAIRKAVSKGGDPFAALEALVERRES